jgi:gluconokinase
MKQLTCSVGLDIGTTSVKAIALNERGVQIARESERVHTLSSEEGVAEQDAHEVYTALTDVFTSCVKLAMEQGYRVSTVGFSAAMHSLLAVNHEGQPLMHAMTWMDTRAKEEATHLWNSPEGVAIYQRTGTPVHAMSPLCKLMWLRHARPDVFGATNKFVSLKEYVWHQWFGEWCVDESIASATGLFHLQMRDWDVEALSTLQISASQLSQIVPTTYRKQGIHNQQLLQAGLPPDVWVNIGASDGVLANLGVNVLNADTLVMTVGTSLALRTGSTKPVTQPSFRPFCYVLDSTRFVIGGPSNSGGILVDWLYNQVLHDGQELSDMALTAELSLAGDVEIGDLVCLPYVAGERAPLWNEDAKASFVGLQLHHRGVHLIRSAIEGIIFNAYTIALGLFEEIQRPSKLVVSGKLFDTPWIRQFVSNVFQLPVLYYQGGDASTVGAIILAHQAAGEHFRGAEEYLEKMSVATIVPDKAGHQIELRRYQRFQRLYQTIIQE